MALRNGQEFIEGLRRNPREVWVAGRRVEEITTDPVFRRPIAGIARLTTCRRGRKTARS
jgi:aromatic ring hydroxylase